MEFVMVRKKKTGQAARLDDLAVQINDSHQECLTAVRGALPHARRTGTRLLEAKELVAEGGWLEWVQQHCRFSVAEAQRYMRIADRYRELLDQDRDPQELTLTEALRLLSRGRKKAAADAEAAADPRFTASSPMEVKELAAEEVRFADGSREHGFVTGQAAALAKHILRLARKGGARDAQDRPVEPVQVAIALLQQLKDALDLSLIVQTAADARPRSQAKPTASGGKVPNRSNGKVAAKG
jgi:hypothetical protein